MDLRRPRPEDKAAILEMMAEFEKADAAHDGGFWTSENFSYEDWLAYNLDCERGLNLPSGFVPAIQFVSFDEEGRALGFLHLRLRLNEFLRAQGGHIGYSIRPSERGKGHAKEQLALGLAEAMKKNIRSILLTCHDDNPASRSVILANGGVLEDIRHHFERYWIEMEDDHE